MPKKRPTVAEQRRYSVRNVQAAKQIALAWLKEFQLQNAVGFGLPEVDDRYHIWRVPLLSKSHQSRVGEVVIDARNSLILRGKSTDPQIIEARLLGKSTPRTGKSNVSRNGTYDLSPLRNIIALGDCEEVLQDLAADSVDLVFTSPPYYNARPEYTDYMTYED